MLAWLASLLGGPVVNGLISAYKARLEAENNAGARAADLAGKAIEGEIAARKSAAEIRKAEGAWGPTGLVLFGFGAVTLAYYGKIVVWDVMLGWGSTEAIRGAVAEWMNTIIIALFGSGTITSVARMALLRLGR